MQHDQSEKVSRVESVRRLLSYRNIVIVTISFLLLVITFQAGELRAMEKPNDTDIDSGDPVSVVIEDDIVEVGYVVTARMSHYWPELGGVNCAIFVSGRCVSRMASGERWEDWIDRAAACPKEIPFWTTLVLPGGERFVCLDRGGKIVTEADGSMWFDLLVKNAPVPYGTRMEVRLIRP